MKISQAALAAALTFTAAPALADDMAEWADADGRPAILVAADAPADEARRQAGQTPGGADVVTHEDYADKSLVSLRDALGFSPGIYLQPRFGQEVRISIRGSGISRGFHMRGLTLLQREWLRRVRVCLLCRRRFIHPAALQHRLGKHAARARHGLGAAGLFLDGQQRRGRRW